MLDLLRAARGPHLFLCKWPALLWPPSRRNVEASLFRLRRGEKCHDASKHIAHPLIIYANSSSSCRTSAPRRRANIGTSDISPAPSARGRSEASDTSCARASRFAWAVLTICSRNFAILAALSSPWMTVRMNWMHANFCSLIAWAAKKKEAR